MKSLDFVALPFELGVLTPLVKELEFLYRYLFGWVGYSFHISRGIFKTVKTF
jgi:hypothetical protein